MQPVKPGQTPQTQTSVKFSMETHTTQGHPFCNTWKYWDVELMVTQTTLQAKRGSEVQLLALWAS